MKNATVYLGVRSLTKGDDAIRKLKEATGNQNVHLLQMDLADLPSVKKAALEFQR
jgi:retinol dehydrogenase 12